MKRARKKSIETRVSRTFHRAFTSHPARFRDPALAVDSARESASKKIPKGVYGRFDDEKLTFKVES